jgi:hypothetical protein
MKAIVLRAASSNPPAKTCKSLDDIHISALAIGNAEVLDFDGCNVRCDSFGGNDNIRLYSAR